MSRTIRRKNTKNPYPVEYSYWSNRAFKFGFEDWEWHNEKIDANPWGKNVKWHTNFCRRNDEKRIVKEAFTDPESDNIFAKEKKYLGIIWIYD